MPSLKHLNYRGYERHIVPLIEKASNIKGSDIKVYCMMREPVEWLRSWWRYRQREQLSDPGHDRHESFTGNINFQEFFDLWLDGGTRPANVGSQTTFFMNKRREIPDINIFKFEDIGALIAALEEEVSAKLKVPTLNTSPEKEADEISVDYNHPRMKREYKIYNKL